MNRVSLLPLFIKFGVIIAIVTVFGLAFSVIVKTLQRKLIFGLQRDLNTIRQLNWKEFEQFISEYFRRQSYTVEDTGGGGPDEGIDLILHKDGEKTFVQCKQWKKWNIGVRPVRELYGVMTSEKASRGILVTSHQFTREARRFSEGKPLELIDGQKLEQMFREVRQTALPTSASTAPLCPRCGAPMILRVARKGLFSGKSFWGCPKYPECKGIIQQTT